MAKLTVLGIGNILMRDDGVGVHLLERVRAARPWGQDVEFVDGGTGGLRLMSVLEGAERLVVFDVADMHLPPGDCRVVTTEQLQDESQGMLSLHDLSFTETLRLCKQLSVAAPRAVIFAVQPADVSPGRELSPILQRESARLVRQAAELVESQLRRND